VACGSLRPPPPLWHWAGASPILGAGPILAGLSGVTGGNVLPSAPGFGYNPHSPWASGSVQPVLPGGPPPAAVAYSPRGPPDKSLFVRMCGHFLFAFRRRKFSVKSVGMPM
jgi:hypothetical protein